MCVGGGYRCVGVWGVDIGVCVGGLCVNRFMWCVYNYVYVTLCMYNIMCM